MEQQPTPDFSGKGSRVEDKNQAQIEAEFAHKRISKQLEQLSKLARIAKESGFEDKAQEADEAMASLIEGVKIEQSKFDEDFKKLLDISIKFASGQSVDEGISSFAAGISGKDAIELFNWAIDKIGGEEKELAGGPAMVLCQRVDANGAKSSLSLDLSNKGTNQSLPKIKIQKIWC